MHNAANRIFSLLPDCSRSRALSGARDPAAAAPQSAPVERRPVGWPTRKFLRTRLSPIRRRRHSAKIRQFVSIPASAGGGPPRTCPTTPRLVNSSGSSGAPARCPGVVGTNGAVKAQRSPGTPGLCPLYLLYPRASLFVSPKAVARTAFNKFLAAPNCRPN